MKILILSNMYPSMEKPYAGVYVKNLYNVLSGMDCFKVDLLVMKRAFTGYLGSICKYTLFCVRFMGYVPRRYDVLHLHFFYPLIFLAVFYKLWHRNTKLVVTYHGSDVQLHGNYRISKKIYRWCARHIDEHVAVGQELASIVKEKLAVSSVNVLPAGVDENVFYQDKKQEKRFDFIFVGSFYDNKGIKELSDAVDLMQLKTARFCFVGSGPLEKNIHALEKKYDVTVFQNQTQDQLRILYSQSRFLVLPSKRESFGLVVTEAMYCGVPALVSAVGGLCEQVVNEYNGLFFDEVSPESISKILDRALKMPPKEIALMSFNALKSNRKFSLKQVVSSHCGLYKK